MRLLGFVTGALRKPQGPLCNGLASCSAPRWMVVRANRRGLCCGPAYIARRIFVMRRDPAIGFPPFGGRDCWLLSMQQRRRAVAATPGREGRDAALYTIHASRPPAPQDAARDARALIAIYNLLAPRARRTPLCCQLWAAIALESPAVETRRRPELEIGVNVSSQAVRRPGAELGVLQRSRRHDGVPAVSSGPGCGSSRRRGDGFMPPRWVAQAATSRSLTRGHPAHRVLNPPYSPCARQSRCACQAATTAVWRSRWLMVDGTRCAGMALAAGRRGRYAAC